MGIFIPGRNFPCLSLLSSTIYSISLENSVPFGEFNFHLTLLADYINNSGELANYAKEVSSSVNVVKKLRFATPVFVIVP